MYKRSLVVMRRLRIICQPTLHFPSAIISFTAPSNSMFCSAYSCNVVVEVMLMALSIVLAAVRCTLPAQHGRHFGN